MRIRACLSLTMTLLALTGGSLARAADAPKPDSPPPPAGTADAAPAKKGSGGRISVEKDVVDVGAVVRGQTATATFVIKNTGTEDLRILSAKPG